MLRYFLRRGFLSLLVALTVSIAAFVLLNVAVDPAMAIAGEDAEPLLVEQIREQYGFDRPIVVQYGDWLLRLVQGNFGESYYWNKPVGELILQHAPVTIKLALMAVCVTILIALPLGALAALNQNTLVDRFALSVALSARRSAYVPMTNTCSMGSGRSLCANRSRQARPLALAAAVI